MTYIVEKGHPMMGRCVINAYDREGGELQAQYSAWYKPHLRQWTLYPLVKNSWDPIGKTVLPESSVKMGKGTKKPPVKTSGRKEEKSAPDAVQIKLI